MVNEMTYYDDELDDLLKEKLQLLQPTSPRDPEVARHRRERIYQRSAVSAVWQTPVCDCRSIA